MPQTGSSIFGSHRSHRFPRPHSHSCNLLYLVGCFYILVSTSLGASIFETHCPHRFPRPRSVPSSCKLLTCNSCLPRSRFETHCPRPSKPICLSTTIASLVEYIFPIRHIYSHILTLIRERLQKKRTKKKHNLALGGCAVPPKQKQKCVLWNLSV